ncbi:MAG: prepilin-type N-terminal cleavage/methylation domain-containing protein [Luteolibacter sp.]
MNSFVSETQIKRRSTGFTLVEMLVVIAIMSILMTAGAIGIGGMGGKGVSSGVATSEALFSEARTTAIGKSMRTCVLVAKTLTNSPADDLRRILVATEESETDPTKSNFGQAKDPLNKNPKWELTSRGTVLPDQTFFSAKYSKKEYKAGAAINTILSSQLLNPKSAFAGEYYIYQFNPQGILTDPSATTYEGQASFIIGNGTRNLSKSSTTAPPKVTSASKRDFGGFVIWRNGWASVFRSPDQMGADIKSLASGTAF